MTKTNNPQPTHEAFAHDDHPKYGYTVTFDATSGVYHWERKDRSGTATSYPEALLMAFMRDIELIIRSKETWLDEHAGVLEDAIQQAYIRVWKDLSAEPDRRVTGGFVIQKAHWAALKSAENKTFINETRNAISDTTYDDPEILGGNTRNSKNYATTYPRQLQTASEEPEVDIRMALEQLPQDLLELARWYLAGYRQNDLVKEYGNSIYWKTDKLRAILAPILTEWGYAPQKTHKGTQRAAMYVKHNSTA